MRLGMIGVGRMGGNMAQRLRGHGHEVVGALGRCLEAGDVVVDGGNSHYRDSIRRRQGDRAGAP